MRFPYVVLLSACASMWTATLLAQSPNGVINGLVVDPSNRTIIGADVVVVNDVNGLKYTTETNDEGIYVVSNLPPGPYRLQVSKVGFKTIIKPDIVLNVQDALSINFTLPIGAYYETVTVEAGASMINTTDASVSTVVDQTYVKNMPLNGRSFQDLILLTPGTTTQTPQISQAAFFQGVGETGEFSVSGQRTEANYYTVDGVSANVGAAAGFGMISGAGASGSIGASTDLGTTQALVSVDDLQEFRVQTSSYSAEYGRNPGGQFAFDTKSGANEFHGTGYDYLRNGFFDANDWFNDYFGVKASALRQNDFGATFGGPVEIPGLYRGKDKTFFFLSYEGLRLTSPQPASMSVVPALALRANSPAPLKQVLNAFPVPNGSEISVPCDQATDPTCPSTGEEPTGLAEFIGNSSNPGSLSSTSARLDHNVNNKLRLFFRFSDTTSASATRGSAANGNSPSTVISSAYVMRTYTAGLTSALSDHVTNELRFNYSSNNASSSIGIDHFGGNIPVDLAQLSGLQEGSFVAPVLLYDGYYVPLNQFHSSGTQRQWNLVDAANLTVGRHRLKFGADYRRLAPLAVPYSAAATYYYLSESGVESNTALTQVDAYAPAYPLYRNFSAFVQDEWRASQHLSLSMGLRWELNPAPGVTRGLNPYTVQGSGPNNWVLAPQGTPLWKTTWYNFAPRLGVAYLLRDAASWETAVRAGGGVFFDTGQQLASSAFNGPGFSALGMSQVASFPSSAPVPVIVNPPVLPYTAFVYGFEPHLQLPYTLQWNASIQQALGKWQALTVSYVAAHGSRLLQENIFQPTDNPIATQFNFIQNGLTSDYESLQAQFQRRLSRGLTALVSYTWSHCIDYGSENYFIAYQRGDCDFDVRHNASAALSYDLPNVGQGKLLQAALRRWGLDDRFTARGSFPVTLNGGNVVDPVTGKLFSADLNQYPGQPVYVYGSQCAAIYDNGRGCPGGRAINPNAFSLPQGCTSFSCPAGTSAGDAPRNFARGFRAWQEDLAIRREFPIHERLKLQLRAEAFNVFNHPNFGSIDPNFGSSTFGQATATLATSLGVLSPLYQMGGPRSMQFALKIIF